MFGITSYGIYIPKFRIKTSEIAECFNKLPDDTIRSLNIYEKSVPARDEDTFTMAYEACLNAINPIGFNPKTISSLFVGSESKPYAVKPTATLLAQSLKINPFSSAVDLEFACKAGSAAMQMIYDGVRAGRIRAGLAVGTDSSQAEIGDILEYGTGSGAAAFIISSKEVIVEIQETLSYVQDIPDFWREETKLSPKHRERFSALTYIDTIKPAAEEIMRISKTKPEDFDYVVFHMPNGSLPRKISKILGFKPEQLEPSLSVEHIGNTYSASSMIGLAKVLDIANPKNKILFVSYGSGAGSDAFIFKVTDKIKRFQKKQKCTFDYYIRNKQNINYSQYLYNKGVI